MANSASPQEGGGGVIFRSRRRDWWMESGGVGSEPRPTGGYDAGGVFVVENFWGGGRMGVGVNQGNDEVL
jgi:hypothetical protein